MSDGTGEQTGDGVVDGARPPDGTSETERPSEPPGGEAQALRAAALEAQLRRALADLDNLRKRLDREISRERASERARVAAQWVPIVDDLERALAHAGDSQDSVIEGVRAVRDQAVAVLERLGYPRYDDVGRPFDPVRDEAVGTAPAQAPRGTVVATVRAGYGEDETILRPAAVIVSEGTG